MTNNDGNLLLNSVTDKTKIFLTKYGIDYDSTSTIQNDSNNLKLSCSTVIIHVHGKLNFTVMMSLEEDVLKKISHTFLGTEIINENDKEEIYNSGAKETVNIVAGLAFSDWINQGRISRIALPIKINDSIIKKFDNATTFSESLTTKFGKLSIKIIDYEKKDI